MSDTVRVGTESDSHVGADAEEVDPDVWSYVDNGEFSTSWAVERVDDTTVEVEVHRHEAGSDGVDGPVETFDIDDETTTEEFARELAHADPDEAIENAREYWVSRA